MLNSSWCLFAWCPMAKHCISPRAQGRAGTLLCIWHGLVPAHEGLCCHPPLSLSIHATRHLFPSLISLTPLGLLAQWLRWQVPPPPGPAADLFSHLDITQGRPSFVSSGIEAGAALSSVQQAAFKLESIGLSTWSSTLERICWHASCYWTPKFLLMQPLESL